MTIASLSLSAFIVTFTTLTIGCIPNAQKELGPSIRNQSDEPRGLSHPEQDELSGLANAYGGVWDSSFGVLGFERVSSSQIGGKLLLLSEEARDSIQHLILADLAPPLTAVPDISSFKKLMSVVLSGNRISRIDRISDLAIHSICVDDNPIDSLGPLSTCTNLELITASQTKISRLPDLSRLSRLRTMVVADTPLTTLDGLEGLPTRIDLVVKGCRMLANIDGLRAGTVNQFVVDDEQLSRFRPWFDEHLEEIRRANPEFTITTIYSGL